MYFPDPWWKARHKKRRVLTVPFLRDVYRTLQPRRISSLLDGCSRVFREHAGTAPGVGPSEGGPLEVPEAVPEHDLDYRTHFERRTRQHGEAVFRADSRSRSETGGGGGSCAFRASRVQSELALWPFLRVPFGRMCRLAHALSGASECLSGTGSLFWVGTCGSALPMG